MEWAEARRVAASPGAKHFVPFLLLRWTHANDTSKCETKRTSFGALFRTKRTRVIIPIYELSVCDKFCHNGYRGAIIMAKTVSRYISELLDKYQEITQKTCTEMAMDFDITLSNLYLYRSGKGNPRATTIDKIVTGIETNCPDALRTVSRW